MKHIHQTLFVVMVLLGTSAINAIKSDPVSLPFSRYTEEALEVIPDAIRTIAIPTLDVSTQNAFYKIQAQFTNNTFHFGSGSQAMVAQVGVDGFMMINVSCTFFDVVYTGEYELAVNISNGVDQLQGAGSYRLEPSGPVQLGVRIRLYNINGYITLDYTLDGRVSVPMASDLELEGFLDGGYLDPDFDQSLINTVGYWLVERSPMRIHTDVRLMNHTMTTIMEAYERKSFLDIISMDPLPPLVPSATAKASSGPRATLAPDVVVNERLMPYALAWLSSLSTDPPLMPSPIGQLFGVSLAKRDRILWQLNGTLDTVRLVSGLETAHAFEVEPPTLYRNSQMVLNITHLDIEGQYILQGTVADDVPFGPRTGNFTLRNPGPCKLSVEAYTQNQGGYLRWSVSNSRFDCDVSPATAAVGEFGTLFDVFGISEAIRAIGLTELTAHAMDRIQYQLSNTLLSEVTRRLQEFADVTPVIDIMRVPA